MEELQVKTHNRVEMIDITRRPAANQATRGGMLQYQQSRW